MINLDQLLRESAFHLINLDHRSCRNRGLEALSLGVGHMLHKRLHSKATEVSSRVLLVEQNNMSLTISPLYFDRPRKRPFAVAVMLPFVELVLKSDPGPEYVILTK